MLSGWAHFRDKVPFCEKNIAKEVGGLIFEVGVLSRDYGTCSNSMAFRVTVFPLICMVSILQLYIIPLMKINVHSL